MSPRPRAQYRPPRPLRWTPPQTPAVTDLCEACGEVTYPSHETAEEAVRVALLKQVLGGSTRRNERRSYECPAGSGWHLTSSYQRHNQEAQR